MQIELKDIQVGDEIIISSGSRRLKYLKVLRPIKEKGFNTPYNRMIYKGVYCSAKREEIVTYTSTLANGVKRDWKRKVYQCAPPDEHNIEIYQNLNGKTIWLVNRK